MPNERNKQIVERFDELSAAADVDGLDAICTPDMINHALAVDRPPGLAGSKQFLAECARDPGKAAWLRSMIAGQRVITIAEGDHVVQVGRRTGRWPGGTLRGLAIVAGEYTQDCAFMYRLRDGRIAERWAVLDDLATILRLGSHPEAPTTPAS